MKKFTTFLFSIILTSSALGQVTSNDSLLHNGIYRQYILHLPTNYNPSNQHELVFALHGGTGSANGMMLYTGFNALSDTESFIVVYPEGIFTGNNAIGKPGHHWADGRLTTTPDTMGIDDVGFISDLIDTLSNKYNVDLNKVYATGISNGGQMAQRLACGLSNKIAAVATVAATFADSLVPQCSTPFPTSILIMNGTSDSWVPTYTGGQTSGTGGYILSTDEMINLWISNNNCNGNIDSIALPDIDTTDQSTVIKYTYPNCDDSTTIVHYKITGGGHTWPGEVFYVPFTGNTNEDIDANREIWNFFKSKSKLSTSIVESNVKSIGINMFPNPFRSMLTVKWPSTLEVRSIEILDLQGKVIWEEERVDVTDRKRSLPLQFLDNGMYLIRVNTSQGSIQKRVIHTSD